MNWYEIGVKLGETKTNLNISLVIRGRYLHSIL